MRPARLLVSFAFGAFVAGCGNHFTPSPHMADAAPETLAPSPDAATLVLVRPSLYAGIMNSSVFVDGKYVGDVEAERQVVVKVPAGDHVLFSGMHDFMTKACRQMIAKVDAGKIYFIEVSVANGTDLFAVRPSDAGKLKGWLARAPITRKLADAQSPMEADEQKECSAKAVEHLSGDDPDDREKHTLHPADGFTAAP
jgi:hypothetical protein